MPFPAPLSASRPGGFHALGIDCANPRRDAVTIIIITLVLFLSFPLSYPVPFPRKVKPRVAAVPRGAQPSAVQPPRLCPSRRPWGTHRTGLGSISSIAPLGRLNPHGSAVRPVGPAEGQSPRAGSAGDADFQRLSEITPCGRTVPPALGNGASQGSCQTYL